MRRYSKEKSGSKNGNASEERDTDDGAECHESIENEYRSARMS